VQPVPAPLKPQTPVLVALRILIAATGASLVLNLVGPFLGVGGGLVSVDVSAGYNVEIPADQWHLHPGVGVGTIGYSLYTRHPDVGQRLWYTLGELPTFLLFAGVLMLAHRLIRGAERDGLFTTTTAGRLRTLGVFVLCGALARTAVETVARQQLLASMVTSHDGWDYATGWELPMPMLMVGAAVLTAARIMRIGAGMHDELQGVV
jgi:hypothetical protein